MKTKVCYIRAVVVPVVALFITNGIKHTTPQLAPVALDTECSSNISLYSGATLMQYEIIPKDIPATVVPVDTDIVTSGDNLEDNKEDVTEAISISTHFIPTNSSMYVASPLNIRSGPDADTDIIGYLDYNDTVNIVAYDSNSNWVKIAYDDKEAYVNRTYLSNQRTTKVNLGEYLLTGYCSCAKCCDVQTGITASGTHTTSGRTIAADKSIPFGTKIEIEGHVYTVEDRGGMINGNHIDIYFDTHEEAKRFAMQYSEVYMVLD